MTNMADSSIIDGELEDMFRLKYTAFAKSSNGRAIPDARDGQKPVHRRVLFQTLQTAPPSRGTVKCASIVGNALGNYHPHGDTSVYDAMCRMVRPYANNVTMIVGQGNFGAIDGSSAAAMRYTEAKLDPLANWLMMDGVDEGAVPMAPNYDGRLTEPTLLPVKMPMLLLNGVPAGSIGVGFASVIPSHNAAELATASKYVLQCMAAGVEPLLADILTAMPGPDFPTGGTVSSAEEIARMYETGRGLLKIRATAKCEDGEGRSGGRIVITSIPYAQNTTSLVEEIMDAKLGKKLAAGKGRAEPLVPEVKDVRDETTTDRVTKQVKVRMVIEVKAGEDPRVTLEKLYINTSLETTFAANMVALDEEGQPIMLTLVEAITRWANFRAECVRRQAAADLERARDREHVINGLVAAIPKIEDVISVVKGSESEEVANYQLRVLIPCTSKQATAILAMRISRLTGLRTEELEAERVELHNRANDLIVLLTSQEAVIAHIERELDEASAKLARPRRTVIAEFSATGDPRDLVVPEHCLVQVTGRGYLKRSQADEFRTQLRGGKGNKKATVKVKDEDVLQSVVGCHSHDRLFAVTDGGAVVRLEAHEVPVVSAGRHAANLGFEEGELVRALLVSPWPVPEEAQAVFATTDGEVKRVAMPDLSSKMTKRLVFFRSATESNIRGGIELPTGETSGDVFLASAHGQGTRFAPSEVRLSKRDSGGVRGMDLREDDRLVSIGRIDSEDQLILCVTSDGIGKRTASSAFPTQGRGNKGRILIRPRPGAELVQALVVRDADSVLIATKDGVTVRIRVGEVKELGRSAMGVKLIALNKGDVVVSAAILPLDDEE